MTVEIDEDELTRLQTAAKVLSDLVGNKETSTSAHQLIKKIHPSHKVPPPDADEMRRQAREEAEAVIAADRKKERDEKLEREFQDRLNSYRLSASNPNGFTEEGIEEIKGLMRARTIPDVDAAVLLFQNLHPAKAEPPSGYMPTGWNFGARGDDDKKLLFEDPDAWSDREARKVWEEYRKGGSLP